LGSIAFELVVWDLDVLRIPLGYIGSLQLSFLGFHLASLLLIGSFKMEFGLHIRKAFGMAILSEHTGQTFKK